MHTIITCTFELPFYYKDNLDVDEDLSAEEDISDWIGEYGMDETLLDYLTTVAVAIKEKK